MILDDYSDFKEYRETMKYDKILMPYKNLLEAQTIQELIPNLPINKRMPYNEAIMIKAIEYGCIMEISYKGLKDKWLGGRQRQVCFLTLGRNSHTGNILARAWHLTGFSVNLKRNAEKVWRLFIMDNNHLKWMMFTGNFFSMPPAGYVRNDRVMSERQIVSADFNKIRANQARLIEVGKIKKEEELKISDNEVSKIEIKNTNTQIDLRNPWNNTLLVKKDIDLIKISILKNVLNDNYIAIYGAVGTKERNVRVFENNQNIGTFRTVETIVGKQIDKIKQVRGKNEFDLYQFVKKM